MIKITYLKRPFSRILKTPITGAFAVSAGILLATVSNSTVVQATSSALASSSTASADEIYRWLDVAINLLSAMVGLVVVISIIVAGIQYMTAGGNSSQVSAAKNRISMAVLAMILFGLAYALLQWLIPGGIFSS